jgi:hypothetical protein
MRSFTRPRNEKGHIEAEENAMPLSMNCTRLAAALALGAALTLSGCSANSGPSTTNSSTATSGSAAAPRLQLAIAPAAIAPGQSAQLSWTIANATACSASGSWSDASLLSTDSISSGPMNDPGVYAFVMSCTGPGGTTSTAQTLSVGAVPAPTVTLHLLSATIQPGTAATLTWSTTGATACSGSGGNSAAWATTQPLSNLAGLSTGAIATPGEYAFVLSCTGPGGQSASSQILTVSSSAPLAAPEVTFGGSPTQLQSGGSTTLTWSTTAATTCMSSGGSGTDVWSGTQPTVSTGTVIGPLAVAGNYTYALSCTGPGGSTSALADVSVTAAGGPPAPTAQIGVSPATIPAGTAARLSWTTSNASSCTAEGSWSGAEPTLGSAVSTGTVSTQGVYAYVLSCSGAGGTVVAATQLTVGPPLPVVTGFGAAPTSITAGGTTTLSWTSTNATSCTASGGSGSDGWGGVVLTTGSGTVVGPLNVPGSYSYVLTCTGSGGTGAPSFVTVTVVSAIGAANITSLLATPSSILTGQTIALSWVSINANNCTASGGTGSDGWNGTVASASVGRTIGPLNVAGVYSYTLDCSGSGASSGPTSVTVTVSAPTPPATINSFAATPNAISTGQTTTLTWSSSNASTCTASGGTGSDGWNGSQLPSSAGTVIGPLNVAGSYTYKLTCDGPGGPSSASAATVVVGPGTPPASILNLTALPASIQIGQTTTLSWSTSNASTCTASGGTGSDGWNGSQFTSSAGTVIGPLGSAGIYSYTLNCSGSGGGSGPSSAAVSVTPPTPAAEITLLSATPNNIQAGQSTTLNWLTINASSCTASGGTGSDGWTGPVATSGVGRVVGPINTPGTYTYTLNCSGGGGTSGPISVTLSVGPVTPAAAIASLAASPSAIQSGQSTTLSWATSNASTCTASGGTGSDGWSGSEATSSSGTVVGPINTIGSYTYTLNCNGPGGASGPVSTPLSVTAPPPGSPTIVITANGANPGVGQTGQTVTLAWSTANATSCTAAGGTGSDGWSGSEATSSSGTVVGPINAAGTYTYTLSCSGPGGSGSSSVSVVVTGLNIVNCGVGVPSKLLLAPATTASSSVSGVCLVGCGVANIGNVTDSNTSDFATMSIAAGVASVVRLNLTDGSSTYPAGRKAGFLLSVPGSLLSLALVPNVTIETLLSGQTQEFGTAAALLHVSALGLFSDSDEAWLEFTTSKPFDAVQLDLASLVGVLSTLRVYGACVTTQ